MPEKQLKSLPNQKEQQAWTMANTARPFPEEKVARYLEATQEAFEERTKAIMDSMIRR